jgi:hypothetical protein
VKAHSRSAGAQRRALIQCSRKLGIIFPTSWTTQGRSEAANFAGGIIRIRPVPFLFAMTALAALGILGADPAGARRTVLFRHPFWPGVCSVFGRHLCAPTVCSVFQHWPCLPQIDYPIGQDLRLTIVTTSDVNTGGVGATPGSNSDEPKANTERRLDTIRDIFDALRACWVPPPEEEARPGMQMSVRFSFRRNGEIIATPRVTYKSPDAPRETIDIYHDAITAALDRCTPLHFTTGLGGAVAGRPIAIRFVDNRKNN